MVVYHAHLTLKFSRIVSSVLNHLQDLSGLWNENLTVIRALWPLPSLSICYTYSLSIYNIRIKKSDGKISLTCKLHDYGTKKDWEEVFSISRNIPNQIKL